MKKAIIPLPDLMRKAGGVKKGKGRGLRGRGGGAYTPVGIYLPLFGSLHCQ